MSDIKNTLNMIEENDVWRNLVPPYRLAEKAEADGLGLLRTAGGPVWLPRVGARAGTELRLRILAQDVLIARAPPEGISALNILAA